MLTKTFLPYIKRQFSICERNKTASHSYDKNSNQFVKLNSKTRSQFIKTIFLLHFIYFTLKCIFMLLRIQKLNAAAKVQGIIFLGVDFCFLIMRFNNLLNDKIIDSLNVMLQFETDLLKGIGSTKKLIKINVYS